MAQQIVKRHPIRGFLYGIFFGLGLVFVVVGQGWAALGTLGPVVVFLVGLAAATLWGLYGPSKAPKGPPPPEPVAVEPTASTRFDDFGEPTRPGDETIEQPTAPATPATDPGAADDAGSDDRADG